MADVMTPLPCPLCRAEPLLHEVAPHEHILPGSPDHPGSAIIECTTCELTLIAPTRDEAVAAWNRRQPQGVTVTADPVAWICEDLICPPYICFNQDQLCVERRAAQMHQGKPAWRVTPLYAAPPAPAAPAMSGWQSMEMAPKDGSYFLAIEGDAIYKAAWNTDSGCWMALCGQPVVYAPEPERWMPLSSISANPARTDDLTVAKRMACTWSYTKWPGGMTTVPDEFWDSLGERHRTAWIAAARAARGEG